MRSAPGSPTTPSPTSRASSRSPPATADIAVTGYTRPVRRPAAHRDGHRHRRPGRGPLGPARPVGHDPHRGRHLPGRRLDLPRPGRQLRRRLGHGRRRDHRGRADRHRQRPEPAVRHAQPGPRRDHHGFVNGETLATSDVTGSPTCTTTAVATSPVAAARTRSPAPRARSPRPTTRSRSSRASSPSPGRLDDHRRRPDQALRHDGHLRRHRVHDSGLPAPTRDR